MYALAAVVVVGGMIVLAWVLGERTSSSARGLAVRDEPYESGMLPTGSARLRLTAKFYLIAMFFVVFDLEAVFIFAWVIAFDDLARMGLGWAGYVEMAVFIAVLVAGLVYLWRQGALDWGPERRSRGSGANKEWEHGLHGKDGLGGASRADDLPEIPPIREIRVPSSSHAPKPRSDGSRP